MVDSGAQNKESTLGKKKAENRKQLRGSESEVVKLKLSRAMGFC